MLSVGLGSAVLRDELNALASDPLKDKYESPPFSVDATDSAKRVQDSICQGTKASEQFSC
ncbi:hypothetical protein DPMN_054508 [Dreissena polymorpha]|uniref:Uncharacterized protein n=1 Tax=Dreissena polymorpha TaxID=45954 RepID=A0A9D4CN90_DREPO|nr:hypothetical protein DPMN_054508 [Dreissena polymorpha]